MSSKRHGKHRRTEDRDAAAELRPSPDNLSAGEAGADGLLRREFLQQAATGGIATAGGVAGFMTAPQADARPAKSDSPGLITLTLRINGANTS
jgi:hypothetical protein